MDFTTLFQRFAEQSPLIVLCGLIIWQLLKMYKEEKKLVIDERDKHTTELKDLNTKKEDELKDFQKIIREQDAENRETIQKLIVTLEGLKAVISEKL